jgi:LmbE family N-acetylglucosaminyl deacetylase
VHRARLLALTAALSALPPSAGAAAPAAAAAPSQAPAAPYDAEAILRAREGLHRVAEFLRSRPALLDGTRKDLLSRDEKLALWGAWATALDHAAVLEARRAELSAWSRQPRRTGGVALAPGRAALYAAYRAGLELIDLVERSAAAARILDEAVPELGLPAGTWSRYKLHHLNAARATEFAALEAVAGNLPAGDPALAEAIDADRAAIWRMGKGKGLVLTARNAAQVVGGAALAAWFPVQKGVSTWMGDTRVRRGDSALISTAQIAALPARLQPGDVLLERREWYLSNLGLPGFWTHAALYVGTPEERRAFFDDPDVRALALAEGQADGDLEALLARRSPEAVTASRAADAAGHPPRVLEALSEGVSFTSLEHSAAADSLAVLRPRLDRRARAVALLRAFHYAGRPYDFDFDFRTDSSLVCSELVYKAYEPGPGMPGVRYDLEEIVGRRIASPNGMARQFDAEAVAGKAQVDLVLFLDGSEPAGRADEAGEAAFRSSWKRAKWHAVVVH